MTANPNLTVHFTSTSAAMTRRIGRWLGEELEAGDLLFVEGPMGAGKTCLIGGMVAALTAEVDLTVTSPTFALVQAYEGRVPVLHVDVHRLKQAEAVAELGLDEAQASGSVLLVEWGEGWQATLGAPTLVVRFSLAGEDRRLQIEPSTQRGVCLAAALAPHAAAGEGTRGR